MVFQVGKITFIYWSIECTPKASFEWVVQLERTTFIYWPIECTPRASFEWEFQFERTTFIYWPIEYVQKLDLRRCSNLKELLSSIDQLKPFT
jgi:hypothetical protein